MSVRPPWHAESMMPYPTYQAKEINPDWHLTSIALSRLCAREVGECDRQDAARHSGQLALPHASERGG